MEQSEQIINLPKKILDYKKYFQKNIFDEIFLDEKDKALSPIVLSDKIPGKEIKKSNKKKKRKNCKDNESKYIRYGSNIVYIDSKIDKKDNGDEFREKLNEQILKIIIDDKNSSETS